jgi:hypothetical protein
MTSIVKLIDMISQALSFSVFLIEGLHALHVSRPGDHEDLAAFLTSLSSSIVSCRMI